MSETIVVVSGTFDPLEKDDLEFLKRAKSLGNWLVVGVHSDMYLVRNHGGFIHNYNARVDVVKELKCVDEVFRFNDDDGTAVQLLRLIRIAYTGAKIIYARSDDEDIELLPEARLRGIKIQKMK
jgi:cytidyltransferase-like protein